MLACCGAEKHQWEKHEVERRWLPRVLRCFIVGENPGDTTSEYFYEPPASYASDEVAVRRALLHGLHQRRLIPEVSLEGFQDAGFLFDHAIRCQLASHVINVERQKAMRYASRLVEDPAHLRVRLAEARTVWVMGHLASNAVANATTEFPKQRRRISQGWVVVVCDDDLENPKGFLVNQLVELPRRLRVAAVDVPIGLPEKGARDADRLARTLMRPAP